MSVRILFLFEFSGLIGTSAIRPPLTPKKETILAIKLKQVAIFGATLAILGGCASAPEQKPAEAAPAPAPKAAPAPAPAPVARSAEAAPAPAPAPAAPKVTTVKGKGLFDFNRMLLINIFILG